MPVFGKKRIEWEEHRYQGMESLYWEAIKLLEEAVWWDIDRNKLATGLARIHALRKSQIIREEQTRP